MTIFGLQPSTVQLLRFRFSWLLLPVFLFALSMLDAVAWGRALGMFLLIHGLLYPASNGYNSYMDRDEDSIGGVQHPMAPTRQLYVVSVWMDIIGFAAAFLISIHFAVCYGVYILFSRLYSYRGIRLKKYPVTGYLTVALNQGALLFYMVYHNAGITPQPIPWAGPVVSTLLIGAFYPITQVYQHKQDKKDGVTTLSYLLGVRGTFVYAGSLYMVAFGLLGWYFQAGGRLLYFYLLQAWYLPVIYRFLRWAWQCWHDESAASFANTMRMNWLAAACANGGFISIILYKYFCG